MLRLSVLCIILVIVGTSLCGGNDGGKGDHGGNGGPGGMIGGPMGVLGLGKEANAVMCKQENLSDEKFEQFRDGVEACGIDDCAVLADDIGTIQKSQNKIMARLHCSQKYSTCLHEKFHKGKGADDHQTDEDAHKEWIEKMTAKKDCVKAAFEKVFGPIA